MLFYYNAKPVCSTHLDYCFFYSITCTCYLLYAYKFKKIRVTFVPLTATLLNFFKYLLEPSSFQPLFLSSFLYALI